MSKDSKKPGTNKSQKRKSTQSKKGFDAEENLSGEEMQILKRKKSSDDEFEEDLEISTSKKMPMTKDDLWDDPSLYADESFDEEEYW